MERLNVYRIKKRLEELKRKREELLRKKKLKTECKECKLPIEYGILKTACTIINSNLCHEIVEKFGKGEISLEETISQLKSKLNNKEKKKFIELIEYIEKYEKE